MFIVFEGCEGSGKTTIIKKLNEKLLENGYDVVITKEPGSPQLEFNKEVRKLIFENNIEPITEAYLYAADRYEHAMKFILPNLNDNKIVISDRWLDSTIAYQCYGRGVDLDMNYELNSITTKVLTPDVIFFIDVKPEDGLSRINPAKREVNRFDLEELDFHNRVYDGYQKIMEDNKFDRRYESISNEKDKLDDVVEKIYKKIKHLKNISNIVYRLKENRSEYKIIDNKELKQ